MMGTRRGFAGFLSFLGRGFVHNSLRRTLGECHVALQATGRLRAMRAGILPWDRQFVFSRSVRVLWRSRAVWAMTGSAPVSVARLAVSPQWRWAPALRRAWSLARPQALWLTMRSGSCAAADPGFFFFPIPVLPPARALSRGGQGRLGSSHPSVGGAARYNKEGRSCFPRS